MRVGEENEVVSVKDALEKEQQNILNLRLKIIFVTDQIFFRS